MAYYISWFSVPPLPNFIISDRKLPDFSGGLLCTCLVTGENKSSTSSTNCVFFCCAVKIKTDIDASLTFNQSHLEGVCERRKCIMHDGTLPPRFNDMVGTTQVWSSSCHSNECHERDCIMMYHPNGSLAGSFAKLLAPSIQYRASPCVTYYYILCTPYPTPVTHQTGR
jgi:hypothetical protein